MPNTYHLACRTRWQDGAYLLLALLSAVGTARACPQGDAARQQAPQVKESATSETALSDATPRDVYRSWLLAVKGNDLAAAKSCWWMSGNDTCGALDAIVGIWVAHHRFNVAMDKIGKERKQVGNYLRDDCTDAAIDRTLERLKQAEMTITGDIATLKIPWAEDDGLVDNQPVFFYVDEPIPFRKTPAGWKIDANDLCGITTPEEFMSSTWGVAFRDHAAMLNDVAAGLESGKLETAADVVGAMERHLGSLDGQTPLTRTVIYEEDTPTRYLRIRKGNPNQLSIGSAELPHRKDVKNPTRVEGDLQAVFEHIYHGRKIVVETRNKKGYEVIYAYHDERALEIVAAQLGMTVKREQRSISAFVLTVGQSGSHLQQVPKRNKPDWEWKYTDRGTRAYYAVTMDELADFLERLSGPPVVNKTGLAGYYDLELSDKAERAPRQGETRMLDQTGLEMRWEKTKAEVVVVKDK
ncbi:MAG: TIGR03435 family protein [Planctomycetes bacterium]|nr:TIGR03435 family protein [Planctomycetota bacterium]